MTRDNKEQFINDHIETIKKSIIENLNKMPENWNGYELREYIAEKFKDQRIGEWDKKRKLQYKNDIITLNL